VQSQKKKKNLETNPYSFTMSDDYDEKSNDDIFFLLQKNSIEYKQKLVIQKSLFFS